MKTELTNEELHNMLVNSYMDFGQVLAIAPLIPMMNDEQKQELTKLIGESENLIAQFKKADSKYRDNLEALNQEYLEKMDHLVVSESNYARQQYENLNSGKDAQEMANLEDQMNNF